MSFQTVVNRNYTTGFPGDIVRDGPHRAKPARIVSATIGTDPGQSTNRISRAFGYGGDGPVLGKTNPAEQLLASVGANNFLGVLGHPKHYVLYGSALGSLSPSMDLPQGAEAEFFDMVTGMVMEVFNEGAATKQMTYGDGVGYIMNTATAGQNPNALPYGALFSIPLGTVAAPPGAVLIPNAKIITTMQLAASAPGALVSSWVVVQI